MADEILDYPEAGRWYRVKSGDRFTFLAGTLYGDQSKANVIVSANSFVLNRGLSPEDYPWIYPGDALFLPLNPPVDKFKRLAERRLPGDNPDDFTLIIGGRRVPVEAGRVVRTMNTLSDQWSAKIAWTPFADPELDELIRPGSFSKASVYLGGELMINGQLFGIETILGNRQSADLTGYSYTVNMLDSSVVAPYERTNISLEAYCISQAYPHSVNVTIDDGVGQGPPFAKVSSDFQSKKGGEVIRLAAQRGLLATSDELGDLVITQAKTDGETVGSIQEGDPGAREYRAKFDGRARFRTTLALGSTGKRGRYSNGARRSVPIDRYNTAVAIDENIIIDRNITFKPDDSDGQTIEDAAKWRKNKAIIDSMSTPFPYDDWYFKGKLWQPNTLITVVSPSMWTGPQGYTYLIQKVEYIFEGGGRKVILSLVPPEAYTKENVREPWQYMER